MNTTKTRPRSYQPDTPGELAENTAMAACPCERAYSGSPIGLALLPLVVAARFPALERLFPCVPGPTRDLWAVTHADLRGHTRVAALVEWMRRRLEDVAAGA